MKSLLELMGWMLVLSIVVAALALAAAAVGAVALIALLWVFLAAAHDRRLSRGSGIGYWRWWGDRFCLVAAAVDEKGERMWIGEGLRQRRIVRLEHQAATVSRRIEWHGREGSGSTRQAAERRFAELEGRIEKEREALYGPLAPPRPHQRAADTDREAAVAALSRAHGEGRLITSELEERVGHAYAAKTYAELDSLLEDLRTAEDGGRRSAPAQRLSDAERERAARMLEAAREEGRLTDDEFAERDARARAARVADELVPLFEDLPDSYALRAEQAQH